MIYIIYDIHYKEKQIVKHYTIIIIRKIYFKY